MANKNVPQQVPQIVLGGFDEGQIEALFRHIAFTAEFMAGFCRSEAEKAGLHDSATALHILSNMAEQIGVLADTPTGGAIVGDYTDWVLGPLFKERRVANKAKALNT